MLKIDARIQAIFKLMTIAGYEISLVGGAVRDLLLNQRTTDYDFTTNAHPEEILTVLPGSFYENQFGTVSLTHNKLQELLATNHFDDLLSAVQNQDQQELAQLQISASKQTSSPRIIDLAHATKLHHSLLSNVDSNSSSVSNLISHHDKSKSTLSLPPYEITTYRCGEIYNGNFRRPTHLQWGTNLNQDLTRRDFTINAMALTANGKLIDPFNGQADLKDNLIRAVGNPTARFQEDALRMMRAIRFSVQLNFAIEPQTYQAIIKHANLIQHISFERLRDELWKMLASDFPAEAIEILDDTGLLNYILPELIATHGINQSGHHIDDVWHHSLNTLRHCPSSDPLVRFACLLHDIGKPPTASLKPNTSSPQWTFYNHQIVGAKIVTRIAKRLHLSSADQKRLYTLVRFHMFHYQPQDSDSAIRRLMRQVGLENLDDLLALRTADRLGSGSRETSWRFEELKQRMIEQLHQPLDISDLAVKGSDLITEFQLIPGPLIGATLHHLLELVLTDSQLNNRQKLLKLAQDYLQQQSSNTDLSCNINTNQSRK